MTVINDEMEVAGLDKGAAMYRNALEHMSLSSGERRYILATISALSDAIRQDQKSMLDGMASAGRPSAWGPAYLLMDSDKLALIVLSKLTSVGKLSHKLTGCAADIADRVKLEYEFEELLRINKQRSKDEKGFSAGHSYKLRGNEAKIRRLYEKLSGGKLKWSISQRLGIGTRLLTQAAKAGVGIEIKKNYEKSRTVWYVSMSEELVNAIGSVDNSAELNAVRLCPMTCPPVPWSVVDGKAVGGYRLVNQRFIRRKSAEDTRHDVDLSNADMGTVLRAVNAIQAVEWKIDKDTLAAAEQMLRSNSSTYSSVVPPVSVKPRKPWYEEMPEEQRKIAAQEYGIKMSNHQIDMQARVSFSLAVALAKRLVDMPVFFVHTLDWRGRIYPVPTHITPQGTDLEKALIRYAEKKPLGKHGLYELKVWAAGCAGVDKVSFDDRVKWFDAEWSGVDDIDEDRRWLEYDSPFLFRQAFKEIRAAIQSGNPEKFMSDVSVCKDGSQNGLQHLSAMGRDEIGGAAVNIIDADTPNDLYADVASLVYAAVLGDAELLELSGGTEDECGQPLPPIAWRSTLESAKVRRSTVKRSVLAYPYGVSKAGMRDGLINDGFTDDLKGHRHRNAWYLAEKIDLSVRDVVVRAAIIMDWLRSIAENAARTGKSMTWIAPSGFPVNMQYWDNIDKIVEVNGFKLTIRSDGGSVDVQAQIRGIVANLVHSYDAAHLIHTCIRCIGSNLLSFQFVHDSYGTHAGCIRLVDAFLRQEFAAIYANDVLLSLAESWKSQGIEVPNVPEYGQLDINSVKTSKYFFA